LSLTTQVELQHFARQQSRCSMLSGRTIATCVPPLDGDWTKYTPPFSASNPSAPHPSVFDPTQIVPGCADDSRSGMRNQNYLHIAHRSRNCGGFARKLEDTGFIANTTTLLQRMFALTVQNNTTPGKKFSHYYCEPAASAGGTPDPSGSASLQQFGPVLRLKMSRSPRAPAFRVQSLCNRRIPQPASP